MSLEDASLAAKTSLLMGSSHCHVVRAPNEHCLGVPFETVTFRQERGIALSSVDALVPYLAMQSALCLSCPLHPSIDK